MGNRDPVLNFTVILRLAQYTPNFPARTDRVFSTSRVVVKVSISSRIEIQAVPVSQEAGHSRIEGRDSKTTVHHQSRRR